MKRRITPLLGLILALALCCTALPMAIAEEAEVSEEAEAVETAESSEETEAVEEPEAAAAGQEHAWVVTDAEEGTEEHAWVTEDEGEFTQNAPSDASYDISQYATVAHQKPNARLNLRAQPSTNSPSYGQYYNGTSVLVLEYGSTWCHVMVNGRVGYMMTEFLSFNNTHDDDITYAVLINPNGGSKVNLRSGPSTDVAIVATFPVGSSVTVYSYGSAWSYVNIGGYNGYVASRFISFEIDPHPAPNPTPDYVEYAVVAHQKPTSRLNLREEASRNSRSLGQYYNGTPVAVLSFGSEWCFVEVDGQYGYMMTHFLQFVDYPLYNEYAGDEYDPTDEVQPFDPSTYGGEPTGDSPVLVEAPAEPTDGNPATMWEELG